MSSKRATRTSSAEEPAACGSANDSATVYVAADGDATGLSESFEFFLRRAARESRGWLGRCARRWPRVLGEVCGGVREIDLGWYPLSVCGRGVEGVRVWGCDVALAPIPPCVRMLVVD